MVLFVPEPPPNILGFTFKFRGIGMLCRHSGLDSLLVFSAVLKKGREITWVIPVSFVCKRITGFLDCWMDSIKLLGIWRHQGYWTRWRARWPWVLLWYVMCTHLSGAVCPISSSPKQVYRPLAPVLPLTDPPSIAATGRCDLQGLASRKFLPPPPRRKEEAGEAPWLRVMPESLHTRFLGWCSALCTLSWSPSSQVQLELTCPPALMPGVMWVGNEKLHIEKDLTELMLFYNTWKNSL